MKTKYYSGNYSLRIGQPYVIISAEEEKDQFFAEVILIFRAFDETVTVVGEKIRYPKYNEMKFDDFIDFELQMCKDRFFFNIIFKKYHEQLKSLAYNVNIQLVETNELILRHFYERFPGALQMILNKTINEDLKSRIKFYQSITFERDDFDIFGN